MRVSYVGTLLAALLCCSKDPDQRSDAESGLSASGLPAEADAGSSADDSDPSVGPSGSGKLDAPSEGEANTDPSAGEVGNEGCQKVDFLFVIDSSGSMQDEQQNLANSFPGFIDIIQNTLMAQDYHIMAIDTDADGFSICPTLCMFASECQGIPCSMIPPSGGCDDTLGAGKTKSPMGMDCGITSGQRYILDSQPNLYDAFACAAQVGTQGSGDEMAIEAMRAAIEPPLNMMGACNEGFVRDDAILVITLITDESDLAYGDDAMSETPTPGTPRDWYDAVVSVKRGNPDAAVVLGLVGDTGQPGGKCQPLELNTASGAEVAPNLQQFVQLFNANVLGSVCETDYAPFFESAVSVISSACDDFEPPA